MKAERNAKMLIVPANQPGKIIAAIVGSAEKLIANGQISSHHRLKGYDGVDIDVWVINSRKPCPPQDPAAVSRPRGTALLLHPLLCSKSWFLKLGGRLADRGWDVVLPDLRAHGGSGGQYITWGAKEKHDLKAVIGRLVEDGIVPENVYVLGASMGGTIGIQYAAIDPRCRGVMALAPPQSLEAISRRILFLSSRKDVNGALALAGRMAGFDPREASAETAAADLACPLLILHGIWDVIVPYDHSKAILRVARGPKRLQPMYLKGHSVEFLNEREMLKYFERLEAMSPRPIGRGDSARNRNIGPANGQAREAAAVVDAASPAPKSRSSCAAPPFAGLALAIAGLVVASIRVQEAPLWFFLGMPGAYASVCANMFFIVAGILLAGTGVVFSIIGLIGNAVRRKHFLVVVATVALAVSLVSVVCGVVGYDRYLPMYKNVEEALKMEKESQARQDAELHRPMAASNRAVE